MLYIFALHCFFSNYRMFSESTNSKNDVAAAKCMKVTATAKILIAQKRHAIHIVLENKDDKQKTSRNYDVTATPYH